VHIHIIPALCLPHGRSADRRRAACTRGWTEATMNALWLALLVVLTTTLAGCEAIGAIFKTGVWAGVIMVVLVLLVVGVLVAKIRS
jgi:hypothetical protein